MRHDSSANQYVIAAAVLLAATVLRAGLDPWLGERLPVITYYLAVIAAAFLIGTVGGIATLLGGAVLGYALFTPETVGLDEAFDFVRYFVICGALLAAARAMRASHARSRRQAAIMADTLRTALDCVVTIDAQDRVVEFNRAAERTFGYTREEVLGRDLADLIVPERMRERHRAALSRYLATGEKTLLDRRIEVPALRKDGSEILVELSVTRISIAEPPLFTAYLRDITERRATESALRESEERYRTTIEQIQDYAIFLIGLDGRAATWHEGVERVTGYSEAEFVGLPASRLFTPEDVGRGVPEQELALAAESGRAGDDRWMLRKDGSRFFAYGLTVARRDDAGNLMGFAKIMRDQTERQMLAEEQRRTAAHLTQVNERQSRFLAMLSHELRNPLAPIRNAVGILRLTQGRGADAAAASEMIGRQVSQMVRLIDDLLDVNRIREGKIRLRLERVDLASVLGHSIEIAQAQCGPGARPIEVDSPPEPLWVRADPTRLGQVVSNLLHNACKFTPGGGRVAISTRREGEEAVIRVRDEGIGIPADQLDRIFGMFEQLEAAHGQAQAGLGIGLSLARSLVEMHGGSIEATSPGKGRGSEFIVRLPLAPDEASAAVAPARPAAPAQDVARNVLVVDDNADAAQSLAMVIRMNGHEVHCASDGEEALEQAALHEPDLVLLDIGLPKLDGYEVARRLRARANGARPTIVALTGWGMEEDVLRAREAGFDAHVTKPIEYDSLIEILARPTMRDDQAPFSSPRH